MSNIIEFQKISIGPEFLTARVRIGDGYPEMTNEDLDATTRVWRLMPQIASHTCVGDGGKTFRDVMGGTEVAHLLEHVAVELMARTNLGDDISYGRTKAVEGVARTYHVQLVCPDDVLCVGALSSAAWILQWAFSGGGFPEPDIDAIVQGLVGMVKRVDKEEKERAAFNRTVAEQQERAEAKRLAKERAEREPWTVVPDDMVDQWAEGRGDLN